VPKINVTFQLDVNGLLSVSAKEEQSGQEQSIKIEGASTLAKMDYLTTVNFPNYVLNFIIKYKP